MKTHTLRPSLLLLLLTFIAVSCSSTSTLTLSVTEPAPVYVPSHIQSIGLLNRSEPTTNQTLNDIDKILSAEGKNLDKEAAENLIQGIKAEFEKNQTFDKVALVTTDKVENPGLGIFPSAMTWDIVDQICTQNNIDALVVLSFYDTDAGITYDTETVNKVNALGIEIPIVEHIAQIDTKILAGFRIYDRKSKTIIDEITRADGATSVGRSINPLKAAQAVVGRKESVLQISNNLGNQYALRTYPYKIRVSRVYYVKGTNNFEIAQRRAQTGDWAGAAELWELETRNTDPKIAGQACYNMGISNEINGDLDGAIAWVSKAYTDYQDSNALRYLKILENRKVKNAQLDRE